MYCIDSWPPCISLPVINPEFGPWPWCRFLDLILAYDPRVFLPVLIPGFDHCLSLSMYRVHSSLWWLLDLIPGGGFDSRIWSLAMVLIPGFDHCLLPVCWFLNPGLHPCPLYIVRMYSISLWWFLDCSLAIVQIPVFDFWISSLSLPACFSSLWWYMDSIPGHGDDSWIWSLSTVYDSQVFFPLIIPGFDPWPLFWFLAVIPGHRVDSWNWSSLW